MADQDDDTTTTPDSPDGTGHDAPGGDAAAVAEVLTGERASGAHPLPGGARRGLTGEPGRHSAVERHDCQT